MTVKSDSNLTNPENPVDNLKTESTSPSVDPDNHYTPSSNDSNLNPDPSQGTGELPTKPTHPFAKEPRKRSGGPAFHKPGCGCNPCSARRRKEEAESRGIRQDTTELPAKQDQVLNGDLPPILVKGRSHRDRIADWAIMRAAEPTLSNKDIAAQLGVTEGSLNVMISRAVKEGWLIFEDPMKRLEHEIIPTVTDNLKYWLKKKDKTVTIETAKGTLFPAYKEAKGIQEAPNTILAIKIEPAQQNDPTVEIKSFKGTIVGTPKGLSEE